MIKVGWAFLFLTGSLAGKSACPAIQGFERSLSVEEEKDVSRFILLGNFCFVRWEGWGLISLSVS